MSKVNKISGTYYISVKLDMATFGYVEAVTVIDKKGENDNVEKDSYFLKRTLQYQTFSGAREQMYAAMSATYYDLIAKMGNQDEMQNLFFVIFETDYNNDTRYCDGYFIAANNEDDVLKNLNFVKLYKQYNGNEEDDNTIKVNSAIFNFGYVTNDMIDSFDLLNTKLKFRIKKVITDKPIVNIQHEADLSIDNAFEWQNNNIKHFFSTNQKHYIITIE